MKGKIINYKADKGFGFILGENNQKYFFHISSVLNPLNLDKNKKVSFDGNINEKGNFSTSIEILEYQSSIVNHSFSQNSKKDITKDKTLRIFNLMIKASCIDSYMFCKAYDSNKYHLIVWSNCGESQQF